MLPARHASRWEVICELRRWDWKLDPIGERERERELEIARRQRWEETQRKRDRVAEQAGIRPTWVFAEAEGEASGDRTDDDAVLSVPAEASESAKHVARAVAHIASIRLALGDTLEFALAKVALGRDDVKRYLGDVMDVRLDRKTVANALAELVALGVLRRVGQLDSWWDTEDGMTKKGAYIYALKVRCRKLGERGVDAVRRLARRAVPVSAAVRGTGIGKRIDGCLSAAIREAGVGRRNALGHWLVCRCTDAGLSEDQTMKVMRAYREAVPQNPPYTAREARATVRSRYRHLLYSAERLATGVVVGYEDGLVDTGTPESGPGPLEETTLDGIL